MKTGITLNEDSKGKARHSPRALDQREANKSSSELQEEEAIKIARAALARQRKHLGSLSKEQEISIQKLIVATAIKISGDIQAFVQQLETSRLSRSSLAAPINGSLLEGD